MGRKNRERIKRIELGLEEPISAKSRNDVVDKTRPFVTTKCPDITSLTEIRTCRKIMRLFNMPKMPQHIIREKTKEGMHKVIAKLEQAGETRESIFNFYWGIAEFRELWAKLGYSENDWREVVNS
jgi:hypothetical protein